ncbi:MAG: lytic transglycosylase domain-containing protein [Nitrospiraceae bacterium]
MPIDLSHYGLSHTSDSTDDTSHTDESRLHKNHSRASSSPLRILGALACAAFVGLATLAIPTATEQSYLYRLVDPTAPRAAGLSRYYEPIIRHYAQWYGVDPALLTAVIRVESSFNPYAISEKGAMGLMQLMPDTMSQWRVNDPMNPHQNIRGGALHIRYLLHRFSDNLELAIAAYHAGPTQVVRHDGIPPFPATHQYVQDVLRNYQQLRPAASREL